MTLQSSSDEYSATIILPLKRRQMGMHQYQMKAEIHLQNHQILGSPKEALYHLVLSVKYVFIFCET